MAASLAGTSLPMIVQKPLVVNLLLVNLHITGVFEPFCALHTKPNNTEAHFEVHQRSISAGNSPPPILVKGADSQN